MKTSTLMRRLTLVVGLALLAGGAYGLYLWNMPHRDVQATEADYFLTADALVREYLADAAAANAKYLDAAGESRVLVITGPIQNVRVNQAGETVAVLRDSPSPAGVACTFSFNANPPPGSLRPGDTLSVKGVIRAGAQYSDVLGFHTDAVLEQCAVFLPGSAPAG